MPFSLLSPFYNYWCWHYIRNNFLGISIDLCLILRFTFWIKNWFYSWRQFQWAFSNSTINYACILTAFSFLYLIKKIIQLFSTSQFPERRRLVTTDCIMLKDWVCLRIASQPHSFLKWGQTWIRTRHLAVPGWCMF